MAALSHEALAVSEPTPEDALLASELVVHLDQQLVSARRLLAIVLEQGAAIRARDVHTVVSCTGLMQAELQRRGLIEAERARLLERAGLRLGIDPGAVTLELLTTILHPASAEAALSRSAELRGLLAEIRQEHHTNRALMNQELSFLDHLLRLGDVDRQTGYDAAGDHTRNPGAALANRHRVLDLEV